MDMERIEETRIVQRWFGMNENQNGTNHYISMQTSFCVEMNSRVFWCQCPAAGTEPFCVVTNLIVCCISRFMNMRMSKANCTQTLSLCIPERLLLSHQTNRAISNILLGPCVRGTRTQRSKYLLFVRVFCVSVYVEIGNSWHWLGWWANISMIEGQRPNKPTK